MKDQQNLRIKRFLSEVKDADVTSINSANEITHLNTRLDRLKPVKSDGFRAQLKVNARIESQVKSL